MLFALHYAIKIAKWKYPKGLDQNFFVLKESLRETREEQTNKPSKANKVINEPPLRETAIESVSDWPLERLIRPYIWSCLLYTSDAADE